MPFSAVVGADDAKLALVLAAIEPHIGGVLLRGDKGSAKTTLARGLAALLGGAPFVDLPVGATEDRVIGSIDLAAALAGDGVRLRPGLLAAADGGVLYVDEVNLLPDHLVDALLDVAATGVNRVEREGIATSHPARFVLVGSMNPEEGELRPQLLDRFGLAVDVRASADTDERVAAILRRLALDAGGDQTEWAAQDATWSARLAAARAADAPSCPPDLVRAVAATCVAVGSQGLRADLTICRAAAALARWEGRDAVTEDDVRRVAPLALAHRARRNPFDDHGIDHDALRHALDDALCVDPVDPQPDRRAAEERAATPDAGSDPVGGTGPEARPGGENDRGTGGERDAQPADERSVVRLEARSGRDGPAGRRSPSPGSRGRLVTDVAAGPSPATIAVGATVRQTAVRRAEVPDAPADIRAAVREHRTGNLIVLAVDASGSMGAERRMEAAKGAILGLLTDAYQRRDRVALVTFRDQHATVVLRPTGSVEVARARLQELPTGGRTPLADGIRVATQVAEGARPEREPLVVLVTDGRATAAEVGHDPVADALAAAGVMRRRGISAVVVDVEPERAGLGLAAEVAAAMGARRISVAELTGTGLLDTVAAARR